MASSVVPLAPESDTLSPLPAVLRSGLTAVAALAALSFVSSTIVLSYLTYKLVRWHIRRRRAESRSEPTGVDLSLGLSQRYFGRSASRTERRDTSTARRKRASPNQFLVLIYNLLLADIHQAAAFLLNASWLSSDSIRVGTPACSAQGWLVSVGDLSSSCFISAIAVHTYLTVVRRYKPPQRAVYFAIICIWVFVYVVSGLGIAITKNGRSAGGYFVRAAAWCWINIEYENVRLLTHYLFIFISLILTALLYTLIFLSLRRSQKNPPPPPAPAQPPPRSKSLRHKSSAGLRSAESISAAKPTASEDATIAHSGGHHPGFLMYPIIYVVCTAPLAFGRVATMAGADVPLGYFTAAGALITSNGWLDVLLWGVTRRSLLFGAEVDTEDSGLATFAFMRTPHARQYGNMIWVEGAGGREASPRTEQKDGWSLGWRKLMGWRRLGFGGTGARDRNSKLGISRRRSNTQGSQESLRGTTGIQMDMVTTVVVEVDNNHQEEPSTYSISMNDSDKEVHQRV